VHTDFEMIVPQRPARAFRGREQELYTRPNVPGRQLFARLAELAAMAEAAGFGSVWVPDHLMQTPVVAPASEPMLEAYTTLGALAVASGQWAKQREWRKQTSRSTTTSTDRGLPCRSEWSERALFWRRRWKGDAERWTGDKRGGWWAG
jgi:hypothetical protein